MTTAIGADAESTEEEYSQACQAAKAWIDQQGGDRKSQIEPFLKTIQDPNSPPGPATCRTPWAQLSPARQAAVIVAVQAAPTRSADNSNHGCEKRTPSDRLGDPFPTPRDGRVQRAEDPIGGGHDAVGASTSTSPPRSRMRSAAG